MSHGKDNKALLENISSLLRAEGFSDEEVEAIFQKLLEALDKRYFDNDQFRILWWRQFCFTLARKRLGEAAPIGKVEKLADQYSSRFEAVSLGIAGSAIWDGVCLLAGELKKHFSQAGEPIPQSNHERAPPLRGPIFAAPGFVWGYIMHGSGLKHLIHPSQRFVLGPPHISDAAVAAGTAPQGINQNAIWLCQSANDVWRLILTPAGAIAFDKYDIPGLSLTPLPELIAARGPFANWVACEVARLDVWDFDITHSIIGPPTIFASLGALEALLEAKIDGTSIVQTDSQLFAAPPPR